MGRVARLGRDLLVDRGHPYSLPVTWKKPDGSANNLTESADGPVTAWVATARDAVGQVVAAFDIDVSQAAAGKLVLSLTAEQTRVLDEYTAVALDETNRWKKTMLRWRMIASDDENPL